MRVKMNELTVTNFQSLLAHKEKFPPNYKCTACEALIRDYVRAELHPLLECLICRTCFNRYRSVRAVRELICDKYGDDNFCQWCSQKDELFVCMTKCNERGKPCHNAFCRDCIVRNVPEDPVRFYYHLNPEAKAKFWWTCYICEPKKLAALRSMAKGAINELQRKFGMTYEEPQPSELRTLLLYDPSRPEIVRGLKLPYKTAKSTEKDPRANGVDRDKVKKPKAKECDVNPPAPKRSKPTPAAKTSVIPLDKRDDNQKIDVDLVQSSPTLSIIDID